MTSKPHRPITADEIETYQRDGLVCMRAFFNKEWVEHLREMTERVMTNPSPVHKPIETVKTEGAGLFF